MMQCRVNQDLDDTGGLLGGIELKELERSISELV
jgi:hypothetical protein